MKSAVTSTGLLLFSYSVLNAAPVLRLSSATIGPILVASAGVTKTQTLEAFNKGDGNLNLSVSVPSSTPWVTARMGQSRPCRTILEAVGKTCSTIDVTISTSGLPQGLSSTTITLSDPNAVDAPQTVTVMVRVGTVSVDVAPGGSRGVEFTTSNFVRASVTPSNDWLQVVLPGAGSFRFDYPYRIDFRPPASMPQGNYSGSVALSGSANAQDNQTIPVAMRVTAQPVAEAVIGSPQAISDPAAGKLVLRMAEGAPALLGGFAPYVSVRNVGQGTLTVSDSAVTGGSWIKKDVLVNGLQFFSIDPAGLTAGTQTGSIVFTTNAVNGTLTVPVELQIVPKGAPTINYQGVVNNATYERGDTVAQGDIMIVKGEQLSFSPFTAGAAAPMATRLGGTSVLVNGTAAPLYYTSYGQIAFQMPVETPVGTAIVEVRRDDGASSNKASVEVAPRAPRVLALTHADINYVTSTSPARPGETIIVWGIGFGATTPAVATGMAPPATLATVTPTPLVTFGLGFSRSTVEPSFAGLVPPFVGLYQLNVRVPDDAPKGEIDLTIAVGSYATTVPVWVQ